MGKAWVDRDGYEHPYVIGEWVWCLHCRRCYLVGEFRLVGHNERHGPWQMCPYKDCDGSTFADGVAWALLRERNAELPEVPVREVEYSEYPGR